MKNDTELIIGLGNPGKNYELTRHNVGFMFLDYFIKKNNLENFKSASKLHADLSTHYLNSKKILLVKPLTFMNNSGLSARNALDFYKLNPINLTLVHDDLDIKFGDYKVSKNKNASGHNGVLSVINHINTKDFLRIRIGIDNRTKEQKINQKGSDYVLGKFNQKELNLLPEIFDKILVDERLDFI